MNPTYVIQIIAMPGRWLTLDLLLTPEVDQAAHVLRERAERLAERKYGPDWTRFCSLVERIHPTKGRPGKPARLGPKLPRKKAQRRAHYWRIYRNQRVQRYKCQKCGNKLKTRRFKCCEVCREKQRLIMQAKRQAMPKPANRRPPGRPKKILCE